MAYKFRLRSIIFLFMNRCFLCRKWTLHGVCVGAALLRKIANSNRNVGWSWRILWIVPIETFNSVDIHHKILVVRSLHPSSVITALWSVLDATAFTPNFCNWMQRLFAWSYHKSACLCTRVTYTFIIEFASRK